MGCPSGRPAARMASVIADVITPGDRVMMQVEKSPQALAVYLASDTAAFTTGTAIPIDGGWTL